MILESAVKYINAKIAANLCEKETHFHGLTIPATRDGRRFPVEDCPEEFAVAIWDDRTAAVRVYHRLERTERVPVQGFGGEKYEFTFILRLYALGIRRRVSGGCLGNAAGFAVTLDSCLPRGGIITASGATGLRLQFGGFDANSERIVQAEFAGHDPNILNPLAVTAAVWDYTLSGITCEDLCNIGELVAV